MEDHAAAFAARRDQAFGSVAIGASVISIGMALVYWASRIGFDNPADPPMRAALLALFVFNIPYALRAALRVARVPYGWATSFAFLSLVAVALPIIGGWSVSATGVNPFPVIAIAGAGAFLFVLFDWVRGASLLRSASVLAVCAWLSTWASGVVWGRIYKSPLFIEMLSGPGVVHHDGVTLAALANMLRTYGVGSMGLDGLAYTPYHWGSPWTFAQLSTLLDSHVLDFYQLGYAVVMVPLFLAAVAVLATEVRAAWISRGQSTDAARQIDLRLDPKRALPLLIAAVGVLPITGMDALGVWTSNLMISESYGIGLPLALLLVGTAVVFWVTRGRHVQDARVPSKWDSAFLFVVLPAGVIWVGYLKISLMIFGFLIAMYLAVRNGLLRKPVFLLAGGVFTALVLLAYRNISLPEHREGIAPLDFLHGFVPPAWWAFYPLVHLFWSILYVVLRLRAEGARTTGDLARALASRRILDVEVVALVALTGIAPGLVIHIDGGSAFYFSDVQRWLSVALLMGTLGVMAWSPPDRDSARSTSGSEGLRVRSVAAAALAIPFAFTMLANSVHWTWRMLRANAELRRGFYPPVVAEAIPAGIRGLPRLRDETVLADGLASSPRRSPVTELMALSRIPAAERRRTAVFISQDERRYWELLARPGACSFAGHVAPALTGIAMIDGMPPVGCRLSRYYGLGQFTSRAAPQTAADRTPDRLCSRAGRWGLTRVLVLRFGDDGTLGRQMIECPRR